MERKDMEAVQAALSDLQQDWATALAGAEAKPDDAGGAGAEAKPDDAWRTVREEQDAEYAAMVVTDLMRAPPSAPEPAPDGVKMKVVFPDGAVEVFAFAPTACVCAVIQLAQARMGKSAPMVVRVRGQAALDANWTLARCGLTSPHVLVTAWGE
jgi:hypothetical protein